MAPRTSIFPDRWGRVTFALKIQTSQQPFLSIRKSPHHFIHFEFFPNRLVFGSEPPSPWDGSARKGQKWSLGAIFFKFSQNFLILAYLADWPWWMTGLQNGLCISLKVVSDPPLPEVGKQETGLAYCLLFGGVYGVAFTWTLASREKACRRGLRFRTD